MDPAETYEHNGVTVEIHYMEHDQEFSNPRDDDGALSTFYLYRPGYTLGDEQLDQSGLPEIDCPACEGEGDENCGRCEGVGTVEPTLAEWAKSEDAIAIAPLFIFEHSMMSISSGPVTFIDEDEGANVSTDTRGRFMGDDAGWDTSFSGFALVTREKWDACFPNEPLDKTKIEEIVKGEVDEYDKYLRGEVYGYVIAPGTIAEESCWGFLGDEYVKEAANAETAHAAERIAKDAEEEANWAARDVMTV